MTTRELLEVLSANGWFISKDEAGDSVAIFLQGERIISVIPSVKNVRGEQAISMRESVSTKTFSKAVSHIAGEDESYWSLKTRFGAPYRSKKFSSEDISVMLKDIKVWAEEVNLESELALKRNLPTSSAGVLPLHHLAALALNNEQNTLEDYKNAFEANNRLGFVPYIQESHIARALSVAKS